MDQLQGKWLFVSLREDNEPERQVEESFIEVRGSLLQFQHRHSPPESPYRITLDATKKERTLKMEHSSRAIPFEAPWFGLYRLVGDKFVICIASQGGELATSIEGGQGMRRMVFKRSAKS